MSDHEHFKGKDALHHVIERRAAGVIAKAEEHGTEAPGHLSAAGDTAREVAVVLLLIWAVFPSWALLLVFGLGFLVWKTGRSAWLSWSRLERLHRVIEEERWEIQHHRTQEREELSALYEAKGFSGGLLEEVMDVLMADEDRLLRVMLEEELGFSLQVYDHPLKQALGAFFGGVASLVLCAIGFLVWPAYGLLIASFIMLIGGAVFTARSEGNRLLPAAIWNTALGALALGVTYFIYQLLLIS